MTKEEVINYISTLTTLQITPASLDIINKSLEDNVNYVIEHEDNMFKINTNIVEGERGSYFEITFEFDKENGNNYLVTTKKEYSPTYELRYGFMQDVGLDLFTDSRSYLINKDNILLYSSSFSDDNKYYGKNEESRDYSRDSLIKYFNDTTPTYNKGVLVSSANSAHQPFTNIWKRYGNTHVIREYGRNPMNGEYSNIGITFDDNSHDDIKLLSESYGTIYSKGREMKMSDEGEIVEKIEQLYLASFTDDGFNNDLFRDSFETEMFESKRI